MPFPSRAAESRTAWDPVGGSTSAGFLDHLQSEYGDSASIRNARLAADPLAVPLRRPAPSRTRPKQLAGLGDPTKGLDGAVITYLTEPEVGALHACCHRLAGPGDVTTPRWARSS